MVCMHRWWALALPTHFGLAVVLLIVFYAGYNLYCTNALDSFHTVTDSFASENNLRHSTTDITPSQVILAPLDSIAHLHST